MKKKPFSFRLSDEAREELKTLCELERRSPGNALEVAIHEALQKRLEEKKYAPDGSAA